jgi:hypothetical protein
LGLRFFMAVAVSVMLVSFSHSLMVQQGLVALGVAMPGRLRVETMAFDLRGLGLALAGVVGLGFLLALPVAAWARRRVPGWLAVLAYPLAGAAALAAALGLMGLGFGMMPLAGARTATGQAMMILSGAMGGLIFGSLRK